LHTDELTYAVIAPADDRVVKGGVLPSYRRISAGLSTAMQILGLPVEVHASELRLAEDQQDPVCFQVPSAYELKVDGRKIIGSAQLRRRGGVLQHGSLPLTGAIDRICQVLAYPDEAARLQSAAKVRATAGTVASFLEGGCSWDEAAAALVSGFQRSLGLTFQLGQPTEPENERAAALRAIRYENSAWNARS
jgi:lipoate-protein ligase A